MKTLWIALGSAATAALLAGCGGGGGDDGGGGGGGPGIAGGGASGNAFVQAVDTVIRTGNADSIEPVDVSAIVAATDVRGIS